MVMQATLCASWMRSTWIHPSLSQEMIPVSSFQISITPSRRVAARFVSHVRRSLQKALVKESRKSGLTQSAIARALGVHRSVINRELRGYKDITLGRVAELAYALGRTPHFELLERSALGGSNVQAVTVSTSSSVSTAANTVVFTAPVLTAT